MADAKQPVVASPPGPSCTRRQLVRGAALAACAPALGSVVGCGSRISAERDVAVGAPVDGRLVVPADKVQELGRAGGAVVLHTGCVNPILLVNTGSGILAMGGLCPHAACELAWVEEHRQAECPCHGSRFAGDGTLLSGPATSNLPAYPATVDATTGAIVISIFAGDGVFPALVNNTLTFSINDHRALLSSGGAVVGRPDGSPIPVVITHPTNAPNNPLWEGGLAAMSALCPHLACTVQPIATSALRCPCHASQFLLDGSLVPLSGPAADNLPPLPVKFDAATGTVTVDFSQFALSC